MKVSSRIKVFVFAVSAIIVAALLVMDFVLKIDTTVALVCSAIFIVAMLVILYTNEAVVNESKKQIEKSLDASVREALDKGNIGILYYDDEFEITWMSAYFTEKGLNKLGEKLLNWIPELKDLMEDSSSNIEVTLEDTIYSITKMDKYSILVFKDITNEVNYKEQLNKNAYVLGLLSYDNMDEANLSEDDIYNINTNLKAPVVEFFKNNKVAYSTLRNGRLLLMLNEEIFNDLYKDRFSILSKIRKVAKDYDLPITLSIAFARGLNNFQDLYLKAESLIDLAQTRGGDQVVVGNPDGEILYFGGASEAREKQSKTKVRVILSSLKDLITRSDKVILVGHKEADSDCIGSMICMSNVVQTYGKEAYLITLTGGIEPMTSEVMEKYKEVLDGKHHFISEQEANDLLTENTLVIMMDHNMKEQSSCPEFVEKASKIVIIDHHRRKANLDTKPLLCYIEASASSSCEIACEFLTFLNKKQVITPEEANMMYLGILIDTDHFRVRAGSRTFEVCKTLKRYGCDTSECELLCEEPFDNVRARSAIINNAKLIRDGIVVSMMIEGKYYRSIASQACDMLVKSKGIDAAFILCTTPKDESVITARSNGNVNVQVILEKIGGGGHLTAAGLQSKEDSLAKLETKLLSSIEDYYKEV